MEYSEDDIIYTYNNIYDLLLTKNIILSYSTNKVDIRDVALEGVELSNVKNVLELGCGYGFFVEKLQNKLHSSAYITGLDLVSNNSEAYMHTVKAINYNGQFIHADADYINCLPENSYDLIICSYSLYFFPYLIKRISEILKMDGIFIVLTHSENSLQEAIHFISDCLQEHHIVNQKQDNMIKIRDLFGSFSLENGVLLLENFFDIITRVDFRNRMIFRLENINDCISYLQTKRNLIFKEVLIHQPQKLELVQKCLFQKIENFVRINSELSLNKDDAIFRCFKTKS